MPDNDGGPAFPRTGYISEEGGYEAHPENGMTLRDYFAAKAMSSLIPMYDIDLPDDEKMTKEAYQIADGMLAARKDVKA